MNIAIAIVVALALFIAIRNFAALMKSNSAERQKLAAMSPAELAELKANEQSLRRERWEGARAGWRAGIEGARLQNMYGQVNQQIVCPHCQHRGTVRTKPIKRKAGISGGKATAAIWTAGISTIATGLSRKITLTQAHCENCNSTWSF